MKYTKEQLATRIIMTLLAIILIASSVYGANEEILDTPYVTITTPHTIEKTGWYTTTITPKTNVGTNINLYYALTNDEGIALTNGIIEQDRTQLEEIHYTCPQNATTSYDPIAKWASCTFCGQV